MILHIKRLFIVLVILLYCALGIWAVPARRVAMTVEQPDGTQLVLTMRGDEHFHCLVTADGIPVMRHGEAYYYAVVGEDGIEPTRELAHEAVLRTPAEQEFVKSLPEVRYARADRMKQVAATRSAAAGTTSEVPTQGEVYVPVLLVQYADVKFSSADPKAAFEERVNGENYTAEGGYGSIREYFVDQSEGKFTPHFDIIGPVTLSNNMDYYGGNDKAGSDMRPREMVSEACRQAYSEGELDFTRYDNNGDGYVDIIYVIYAGYGEASYPEKLEDTVWPHQWQLGQPLTLGDVKVSRYACNNELDGYDGAVLDGIGTFCHEFSHCLGLPDFYDTAGGSSFGMNVWSLMDYGCYNNNGHTPCGYTAYEKDFLGWKQFVELNNPVNVTLKPLSEGGEAYKIVNDANPNEFYVVEYYRKTGWNAYAPADGMLVLHVDYLASAWQNNVVNNDSEHQRMTLIPADGKLDDRTLAGDLWTGKDGKTALTASSTPAAKVYTGGYMEKDITNIALKGGTITFSFMQGELPAPNVYAPDSIMPSGFTMAWEAIDSIAEYEVRLDRLEENPYLIDEDFAKVKPSSTDIGTTLDAYTEQPGWLGGNVFGLDGAIRIGSATGSGLLMSPNWTNDSSAVTITFTIRKSNPDGGDAYMIMAVGDSEWGNSLYGYGLTIEDKEWTTYSLVIDSLGNDPYLYIDTRDNDKTTEKEAPQVDLDALYLLPGDRSEEISERNKLKEDGRVKQTVHLVNMEQLEKCQAQTQIAHVVQRSDSVASSEDEKKTKRYNEVHVHTVLVTDSCYTFSELDGGLYRCRVRSVKDGAVSHYSNAVEVELIDTLLPQTDAAFELYIHDDSMYVQAPDSIAVYYTTDGSWPTAYSMRYDAPIALGRKMNVRAIARSKGCRSSEVVDKANWFVNEGVTYRVISSLEPTAMITEANKGNGTTDYVGHFVFGNEVVIDSLVYVLSGIDSHAFRDAASLRSMVLEGDSLRSIGDSIFHGCTGLNAVVWDVNLPMEDNLFDEDSYYNLLVYLPDTISLDNTLIQAKRMVVVKEGKSGALQLANDKSFYCPRSFVAERISYQRNFIQTTGLEASAGWETIALPFDVQHITHAGKGDIAPFGVDANNNFWLATLDGRGFVPATVMQANVPYIIAMPNHIDYGEYAMSGMVTFSAENTTIHATDEDMACLGADFSLVPTYEPLKKTLDVYALNVNVKYDSYAAGSVFVANEYAVSPFSAYAVPNQGDAAPMYRIAFVNESAEEDSEWTYVVAVRGGVVYIATPHDRVVKIYDMAGRRVCTINCKAGINEVTSLAEGMYIVETTKIYVER